MSTGRIGRGNIPKPTIREEDVAQRLQDTGTGSVDIRTVAVHHNVRVPEVAPDVGWQPGRQWEEHEPEEEGAETKHTEFNPAPPSDHRSRPQDVDARAEVRKKAQAPDRQEE
ncbi:MAG TPA: hypothetical protein VF221_00660 [Chloroflexota bacterium]